jgi:hypothetical protein
MKEIQTITHAYREIGWEEAVGSSGSAKALVDILELNGLSDGGITRSGLERLRNLDAQGRQRWTACTSKACAPIGCRCCPGDSRSCGPFSRSSASSA